MAIAEFPEIIQNLRAQALIVDGNDFVASLRSFIEMFQKTQFPLRVFRDIFLKASAGPVRLGRLRFAGGHIAAFEFSQSLIELVALVPAELQLRELGEFNVEELTTARDGQGDRDYGPVCELLTTLDDEQLGYVRTEVNNLCASAFEDSHFSELKSAVEIERPRVLQLVDAYSLDDQLDVVEDGPAGDETPQYVTLDQLAAIVKRSKRALQILLGRQKNPLPAADIAPDQRGKPHEWIWQNVRPWLEEEFGKRLPPRYPERPR